MRIYFLSGARHAVLLAILLVAAGICGNTSSAEGAIEQIDVFISGTEGYNTYRIPAIVRTRNGTLLAFCEGRKAGGGDAGDIDLMLRRSTDGGKTWEKMQIVHEAGGRAAVTIGNPCPVVDRETGTIWLPFCRNNDRIFVTHSTDDGKTWAKPVEITKDVKKPEWGHGHYATGPGHGIQLSSGRLVIPCDAHLAVKKMNWRTDTFSLVFYSDDHGKTWKRGGVTIPGHDECEVVERANGSLLLSMRNYRDFSGRRRSFAVSTDAGLSWSKSWAHEQVYCPVCQSSIQRYSLKPKNRILYSGPGGRGRRNMTVRLTYDGGKTWPVAKSIYGGPAAYSDLVVLPDENIGCLYERDGYRKITFARFSLKWLTGGKDKVDAAAQEPRTFCRYVPERTDDFAWENDLIAFRMYGPKLRKGGENNGIDCWLKRVKYPVINKWYGQMKEKSYHEDHGEGHDPYHVGCSAGTGGTGIWLDGRREPLETYTEYEVLKCTPGESRFKLTYNCKIGGAVFGEEKIITIELGKRLIDIHSVFTKDGRIAAGLPICIGVSTHDGKAQAFSNKKKGWVACWEKELAGSELGTAAMMAPEKIDEIKVVDLEGNDNAHIFLITKTDAKGVVEYKAGYGWKKAGQITTRKAWEQYLNDQ